MDNSFYLKSQGRRQKLGWSWGPSCLLLTSKSFGHRFPLQEGWTKHRHFPQDGWTTIVLHIQQPGNYSKTELSSQSFPDGKMLLTGLVLDHQLRVWVSRAVHYQSALLICTDTNTNPTTSVLPEVHFIGNVAAVISAQATVNNQQCLPGVASLNTVFEGSICWSHSSYTFLVTTTCSPVLNKKAKKWMKL